MFAERSKVSQNCRRNPDAIAQVMKETLKANPNGKTKLDLVGLLVLRG